MKRIILFIGLIFVLSSCSSNAQTNESYGWTENVLIAHAAGGINGKTYTNSKEAFEESYKSGYRLLEVDLSITSDGHLVARHGWDEEYGQQYNPEDGPLNHQEFMQLPYYNIYSPMDFKTVLKMMEEYPEVHVILDGKVSSVEDTKVLYKKIGEATENISDKILNRLIPQMFYKEDVEVIRQHGFHDLIYVVGREEYTPDSIAGFCSKNDIRVVSLSRDRTNREFVEKLQDQNVAVYMYTLNDVEEMTTYFDKGVQGFFTDFVKPKEINKTTE